MTTAAERSLVDELLLLQADLCALMHVFPVLAAHQQAAHRASHPELAAWEALRTAQLREDTAPEDLEMLTKLAKEASASSVVEPVALVAGAVALPPVSVSMPAQLSKIDDAQPLSRDQMVPLVANASVASSVSPILVEGDAKSSSSLESAALPFSSSSALASMVAMPSSSPQSSNNAATTTAPTTTTTSSAIASPAVDAPLDERAKFLLALAATTPDQQPDSGIKHSEEPVSAQAAPGATMVSAEAPMTVSSNLGSGVSSASVSVGGEESIPPELVKVSSESLPSRRELSFPSPAQRPRDPAFALGTPEVGVRRGDHTAVPELGMAPTEQQEHEAGVGGGSMSLGGGYMSSAELAARHLELQASHMARLPRPIVAPPPPAEPKRSWLVRFLCCGAGGREGEDAYRAAGLGTPDWSHDLSRSGTGSLPPSSIGGLTGLGLAVTRSEGPVNSEEVEARRLQRVALAAEELRQRSLAGEGRGGVAAGSGAGGKRPPHEWLAGVPETVLVDDRWMQQPMHPQQQYQQQPYMHEEQLKQFPPQQQQAFQQQQQQQQQPPQQLKQFPGEAPPVHQQHAVGQRVRYVA
jgi:hypothetical protein